MNQVEFNMMTGSPAFITLADEAKQSEFSRQIANISAFVHVAYGYGAESWNARWRSGRLVGVNEPFAYGYHKAEQFGCAVTYSTDHPEAFVGKSIRYTLRGLLGFDLIHALRNRKEIMAADVVWTHTESQSLAVAMLLRLGKSARRPKTILQSVWLIDRWSRMNFLQRFFYHRLLRRADILSFHSALNYKQATLLFPHQRIEHVLFGINADQILKTTQLAANMPMRVLAVGNDRHRDWTTLRDALADDERFEFRIVSTNLEKDYLSGNGKVISVASNDELFEQYRWADVAVVPLRPNLHASGITAVEEAITRGVAVVCSDTGGLRDYFSEEGVCYVAVADPPGLRRAIESLCADPQKRGQMVECSQRRITEGNLNSRGFARRHVELSRELLGAEPGV